MSYSAPRSSTYKGSVSPAGGDARTIARDAKRSERERRGPPFVETAGRMYVNLFFDFDPPDPTRGSRLSRGRDCVRSPSFRYTALTPTGSKLARRTMMDEASKRGRSSGGSEGGGGARSAILLL